MVTFDADLFNAPPQLVLGCLRFDDETIDLEYLDVAAGRALVCYERKGEAWLDVRDVLTGAVVFAKRIDSTSAATMTPDGTNLLWFDEGGLNVTELERSAFVTRGTGILPVNDKCAQPLDGKKLDDPQCAVAVAERKDANAITVVVGDYGSVVAIKLKMQTSDTQYSVVSADLLHDGLAYGPVYIDDVVPYQSVAIDDVTAFHPSTLCTTSCSCSRKRHRHRKPFGAWPALCFRSSRHRTLCRS